MKYNIKTNKRGLYETELYANKQLKETTIVADYIENLGTEGLYFTINAFTGELGFKTDETWVQEEDWLVITMGGIVQESRRAEFERLSGQERVVKIQEHRRELMRIVKMIHNTRYELEEELRLNLLEELVVKVHREAMDNG